MLQGFYNPRFHLDFSGWFSGWSNKIVWNPYFFPKWWLVFDVRHKIWNTVMNLEQECYKGLLILNFFWTVWAMWHYVLKSVFFDQMMAFVQSPTHDLKHRMNFEEECYKGLLTKSTEFIFIDQMMAGVRSQTRDPKHGDEFIRWMLQWSPDSWFHMYFLSNFWGDVTKLTEIGNFWPDDGWCLKSNLGPETQWWI